MSKSGQHNYKGINAQAWAAMSLFLQYLRDSRFSSIELEAVNFEDFNLVFNDGKKIICESKDRKEKFSYPHLKELLENISNKRSLNDKDEILVICSKANADLISDVRNVKYFDELQNKFIKKGYSTKLLTLLSKVQFWVVPASFNKEVIYSLFTELVNFWISPEDIRRFVDSILIQKIYKGSANGTTFGRSDLLKEINNLAVEARQNSVYYNAQLSKREQQFWELEKALNNPNHATWKVPKELSAFSTDYERLRFAKDRLENKHNELVLKNWDPVWKLNRVYAFNFGIFHVFENNLHTDKNRKYILSYIKKYTKTIRGFYRSDFFDVDVEKIVTKIIEGADGAKYLKDAFAIVNDLITFNEKDFFYLKDRGYDLGKWEKGEICKLLHKIYTRSDATLKQKVFDLIVSGFNVAEDDGEFIHHAPTDIYEILREWLDEDFKGRFSKIVKLASDQYQRYYKKFGSKVEFKGWEHMGGGTSFGPGGHRVGDRHFIGFILAPAIRKYYDADKIKGWKFIKQQCITTTAKVSKIKPDFLNRSVYEIVLSRYADADKKISNEAFAILKEFILSRKGIPHKTDLIYQAVVGSNMPDDKKWRLIEITTKKYGIPVNPFAEQIVANLARKGYQPAKATLKQWFADPKYYKYFMFDLDSVSSITAMLDSDLGFAAELFKALVTSDYVKNGKSDHFGAYTVAALLNEIIRRDYTIGLSIIRLLESEEKLSNDQQIIYSFSLFNHHGNDDSDDQELLLKVYNEVVNPFLEKHGNDIAKICQRLTDANCREAFVQFAARLAVKKKMAEALRIVRIFVNDPDPYLPGKDPHDPEDKYNEHKSILEGEEPSSIRSVRGWCGWVLMKCSVLDGRDQIPEVIELTKKLIEDKNYYVVHMACFALLQLAQNRLTVLPDNRQVLFFGKDKREALERAKQVEKIAFNLLENIVESPNNVKKALAKSILSVFDHIRTLNEEDALNFVNTLKEFPDEAIAEAAPLFIFFAEFRKNAFKNWKWSMPGFYDDLTPDKHDDKKFKKILLEVMDKIEPKHRFSFAAQFEHMIRDLDYKQEDADKLFNVAYYYLGYLSKKYNHDMFRVIYMTIKNGMQKNNNFDKWYDLFLECLKKEKDFYDKNFRQEQTMDMYWWPSFYNSEILELINEKDGKEKFIEAARIIFSFPKQLEIHESEKVISILKEFPKNDKRVREIFKYLLNKNPSKYWDLK